MGLPQFHSASRISILGRTGQGKTDLCRAIQELYPRVIIIDLVNDYRPDGNTHFFRDFKSFGNFLIRYQKAPKFRLCFQFRFEDQNFQEIADEIFRLAYKMGRVLVVVDEVQNFLYSHWLNHLILVGRRQEVAVICSTQRPANVSKDVISQSSDLYVGKLFETNDLKYLSDILNPEDVEKLPHLRPFHFLHFRPGEPSRVIYNRRPLISVK